MRPSKIICQWSAYLWRRYHESWMRSRSIWKLYSMKPDDVRGLIKCGGYNTIGAGFVSFRLLLITFISWYRRHFFLQCKPKWFLMVSLVCRADYYSMRGTGGSTYGRNHYLAIQSVVKGENQKCFSGRSSILHLLRWAVKFLGDSWLCDAAKRLSIAQQCSLAFLYHIFQGSFSLGHSQLGDNWDGAWSVSNVY